MQVLGAGGSPRSSRDGLVRTPVRRVPRPGPRSHVNATKPFPRFARHPRQGCGLVGLWEGVGGPGSRIASADWEGTSTSGTGGRFSALGARLRGSSNGRSRTTPRTTCSVATRCREPCWEKAFLGLASSRRCSSIAALDEASIIEALPGMELQVVPAPLSSLAVTGGLQGAEQASVPVGPGRIPTSTRPSRSRASRGTPVRGAAWSVSGRASAGLDRGPGTVWPVCFVAPRRWRTLLRSSSAAAESRGGTLRSPRCLVLPARQQGELPSVAEVLSKLTVKEGVARRGPVRGPLIGRCSDGTPPN